MRKKLLVSHKGAGSFSVTVTKGTSYLFQIFFPTGSSSLPLRTTQLSVRQVTFFILMIIVLWHC